MRRRDFLKAMFAASMAPAIVKAENIMRINPRIITMTGYIDEFRVTKEPYSAITEPFYVDSLGKIHYTGKSTEQYSVLQLHRFLMDWADNPENIVLPNPSLRYTDEYIALCHGYSLSEKVLPHLYGGTLCDSANTGLRYTGCSSVDTFISKAVEIVLPA